MPAPVLRWGKSASAPPPPQWIHIHCQQAPKDRPEHVCFLGEFEELPCHYLHQTREQRGRSVPCAADPAEGIADCEHCLAGIPVRVNCYAPALVHRPGDVVGGRAMWQRVVYFVPTRAVSQMRGVGPQRGKLFACWREKVGGAGHFKSRFQGNAFRVEEPTFDVKLLVRHLFYPNPQTVADVKRMLDSLPLVITPPSNKPNPDQPLSDEERELVRKMLADHRAKNSPRLHQPTEDDLLSKGTAEIINAEVRDSLPDGHPAKKPAKRKGGAA